MLEINKIHNMECIEGMRQLEDNSVDSIVTDPPYELGFMGRGWDRTGIAYNVEMWKECLRVLKPGGYLLSFGGSRTYHRMACAIEDAGFTIHPMIGWIAGQGFPKAANLSKQFDRQAGAKRPKTKLRWDGRGKWELKVNREKGDTGIGHADGSKRIYYETVSATPEAQQWGGWYYGLQSLKPALEPCCMTQKPIDSKRMTDNVLKWGTGAVNIDGCRIGTEMAGARASNKDGVTRRNMAFGMKEFEGNPVKGRFPANVIFSKEVGKLLDEQSGISKSSTRPPTGKFKYANPDGGDSVAMKGSNTKDTTVRGHNDSGGASRYFKSIEYTEDDFLPFYYCAKASKKERGEGNTHPTVKPLSLIKYLLKLVTPPNGLSLDPFMGSGTHALACIELGFDYIGFELGEDYCEIAEKRIANKKEEIAKIKIKEKEKQKKESKKGIQKELF